MVTDERDGATIGATNERGETDAIERAIFDVCARDGVDLARLIPRSTRETTQHSRHAGETSPESSRRPISQTRSVLYYPPSSNNSTTL